MVKPKLINEIEVLVQDIKVRSAAIIVRSTANWLLSGAEIGDGFFINSRFLADNIVFVITLVLTGFGNQHPVGTQFVGPGTN